MTKAEREAARERCISQSYGTPKEDRDSLITALDEIDRLEAKIERMREMLDYAVPYLERDYGFEEIMRNSPKMVQLFRDYAAMKESKPPETSKDTDYKCHCPIEDWRDLPEGRCLICGGSAMKEGK